MHNNALKFYNNITSESANFDSILLVSSVNDVPYFEGSQSEADDTTSIIRLCRSRIASDRTPKVEHVIDPGPLILYNYSMYVPCTAGLL